MTIEADARAFFTPGQVASIASLAAAASRDKVTPILAAIKVHVGPRVAVALATDRYMAARLTFTRESEAYEGPEVGVDAVVDAADWVELARTKSAIVLTIADAVTAGTSGGTTFALTTQDADFPPVDRLFPNVAEDDLPAGVMLNPDLLARLSKFALPGEKPLDAKKAPWSFAASARSEKHGPVVASRSNRYAALTVLLQPSKPKA